jgi:type III pantothenate kinase
MLLAVDAGNTRIKWGLHDGAAWIASGSVPTAQALRLEGLWSGLAAKPRRAIVSNVAGSKVGEAIAMSLARVDAMLVPFAPQAEQAGVMNRYDAPRQLGADRWAALIAARRRVSGACVVVNAGTAIVIDALTPSGEFLGGVILPGIDLMVETLARRVESLRVDAGRFADFPRNTPDAMESGAIDAAAGAIDAMARKLEALVAAAPMILLSGGAAPRLLPHITRPVGHVDTLVLDGLVIAAT